MITLDAKELISRLSNDAMERVWSKVKNTCDATPAVEDFLDLIEDEFIGRASKQGINNVDANLKFLNMQLRNTYLDPNLQIILSHIYETAI